MSHLHRNIWGINRKIQEIWYVQVCAGEERHQGNQPTTHRVATCKLMFTPQKCSKGTCQALTSDEKGELQWRACGVISDYCHMHSQKTMWTIQHVVWSDSSQKIPLEQSQVSAWRTHRPPCSIELLRQKHRDQGIQSNHYVDRVGSSDHKTSRRHQSPLGGRSWAATRLHLCFGRHNKQERVFSPFRSRIAYCVYMCVCVYIYICAI